MTNKKGDVTSISSINQLNQSSGELTGYAFDNTAKTSEKQRLCICGAKIPRDEIIFENARACSECRSKQVALTTVAEAVITTPRVVVKCEPCKSCKKPYALAKLSKLLVCKNCLAKAQTESPSKRNRIIAGIIENYAAALRRQISMGGQG